MERCIRSPPIPTTHLQHVLTHVPSCASRCLLNVLPLSPHSKSSDPPISGQLPVPHPWGPAAWKDDHLILILKSQGYALLGSPLLFSNSTWLCWR